MASIKSKAYWGKVSRVRIYDDVSRRERNEARLFPRRERLIRIDLVCLEERKNNLLDLPVSCGYRIVRTPNLDQYDQKWPRRFLP